MGYAAARGGLGAIAASESLVRRLRLAGDSTWLGTDQIVERLRLAVDRVMGEGGLWDPELAAVALRQAEGDPIEAAHLVRAYRSTLPRLAYSDPIDADELEVLRRVVPAFRDPPGPQLLGRTTDYTGRLVELVPDDDLRAEGEALRAGRPAGAADRGTAPVGGENGATGNGASGDGSNGDDSRPAGSGPHGPHAGASAAEGPGRAREARRRPPRLYELLRSEALVVDRRRDDDPEPFDLTRRPPQPPAPRSARLAAMARAETGALVNLWYRNILGPDGYIHEVTLGEVRHGHLPVPVRHPHTGGTVRIGRVRATEVEAIEDLDGPDEPRDLFDVGYGLVLGHNERKAIAMANLDISCHRDAGRTQLEQSLLLTTDGLDASGFLEHLKLPHYVTFRSMVERKLAVRRSAGGAAARPAAAAAPAPIVADPTEGDCA